MVRNLFLALKNTFSWGRATRSEYWFFKLFLIIAGFLIEQASPDILLSLAVIFGFLFTGFSFFSIFLSWSIIFSISIIFFLIFLLISELTVNIRRLHDTNRSGWWLLINIIPIIGNAWYLILMLLDSHSDDNKYGPNPKL